MASGTLKPIEIFYSYAHEDEELCNRLDKHLTILKRQGLISSWYDRQIVAGDQYEEKSIRRLNSAHIIILLISPDFLASDYRYGIEVHRAMERYGAGEACVVPILLRAVDYQDTPFEKLSPLPANRVPIKQWPDLDEAFKVVAAGIRDVIDELNEQSSSIKFRHPSSSPTAPCPYRGLSAFQEEDVPFFFGREVFTTQLMQSVRSNPLTAVIGPSGCGKSSLVFAGLLPQLRKAGSWRIASFRPLDHPFRSLAAALTSLLETQISDTRQQHKTKKLAELLEQRKISLLDIIQLVKQKFQTSSILLYIDQFEELYTQSENEEIRQKFLDVLLEAVQGASQGQVGDFTLVLTLRADFLGQALLYRPLADALQNADLKLSSMTRQELEIAIKKPAQLLQIGIEDGLSERILDAISQEPGNLPLLEFTLTQLWDKQNVNSLTHHAYDEIGGVQQSLATYADNIYAKLDENEKQDARSIFTQMVYPGDSTEDIRRIATRAQLGEDRWNLVVYLSDARLMITNRDELTGEETVEVVHEALIRGWGRLRDWMKEDRDFRLWQERLRTRIIGWKRASRSHSELLRGMSLAEAESWLAKRDSELDKLEQDFIRASRDQQKQEKQRMQQLLQISTASSIPNLVENVLQLVTGMIDVSSMLFTIYDHDTKKIYDVFALDSGKRIDVLLTQPIVTDPKERRIWWQVTQEKKTSLLLSLRDLEQTISEEYEELLKGAWGDQRKAGTFLLLPIKTSRHVIGSLCLTSTISNAYQTEEVLDLEAMVQSIAMSLEHARLYDWLNQPMHEHRQPEKSFEIINSAFQIISSVLDLEELLDKFVEMATKLIHADLCTFFQLSPNGEELIAKANFDTSGKWNDFAQTKKRGKHAALIEMIRLPFRNSVLEKLVDADTFFYLNWKMVEELAQAGSKGGAIYLRETRRHKMMMIPVRYYQTEIVGVLAVHTLQQDRVFQPEEVGTLLAISSQVAIAIRNAQTFEQLLEANAELQRMDRLKDEFIVTASHELRTPLSAISGYAAMLKRQSARIDSQQALRYATKISGATQQLTDLIAQMTDASKVGSIDRKLELQVGPVQVLAAAEIATTLLSVNIEQTITVQIEPDLWVQCDGLRLRQVVTNLLDNAAKYSPPNGQIVLSASSTILSQLPEGQVDYTKLVRGEDPPVVLVRVCDEGEGIPLEDQEKVFEKFVRATRSLTTQVRGSGLGLFICRRYIEAMGGKLWLEASIPGEGSIFSFYLPRIEAPDAS